LTPSEAISGGSAVAAIDPNRFLRDLQSYCFQERQTQELARRCASRDGTKMELPVFVNQFWSRGQRAGSSLHRVAYRGMFSPLLRFFIETLSRPDDVVYDPFMSRGTVPVEAALLSRIPFGTDANGSSWVARR
jgi:tRNA G10  N-methylase Trm11